MTDNETQNAVMIAAIKWRHREHWHLAFELRTGTGYKVDANSFLDAFAMHEFPSKGLARVTYEIKVSRSDFLRELKKPRKRRIGLKFSNKFWFITPPGVAKPEEIPAECGLLEVQPGGCESIIVVDAPQRDSCPPTWLFVSAIFRRSESILGGHIS